MTAERTLLRNDAPLDGDSPGAGQLGWRRRYGRLAALGLGIVAALVVFQFALGGVARRLHVVATPQHFTELSFAHPNQLRQLGTGGTRVPVSFVVHNEEGARRSYRWSVVASGPAVRRTVTSGVLALAAGRSARTDLEVPVARLAGATLLTVRLTDPAESIDVHLHGLPPVEPPPAIVAHRFGPN